MHKKVLLSRRNNYKFRNRLEKVEIPQMVLKYLSKNSNLKNYLFSSYFFYLVKTINKRSFLRINNFCIYTGRNKGLIRFTRMSKVFLKMAVREKTIVGIRKAI